MGIDEMKNKISLALKDPILQLGFEIICKKLSELEKACDETEELLDKQIEATYKVVEELNKAKELLNEFMRISKASDEDFEHDYSELIVEAEAFLKE